MPVTTTIGSNDAMLRVRARMFPGIPPALVPRAEANVALCFDGAFERLGRSVIGTQDQHLLMKDVAMTPVLGVVDLTVAAFKNCLFSTLGREGCIKLSSGAISPSVRPVREYNLLLAKLPKDCVWYFLNNTKLVFKNPADGLLTTYVTALKANVSYIPTIDDATLPLPDELVDQWIDRLSEIVQKIGGMAFLKADEESAGAMLGGGQ